VGARLVRDGDQVLFCDADAEHVATQNAAGVPVKGRPEHFPPYSSTCLPALNVPEKCTTTACP
jgi:hypothetical protein